MTEADLYSPDLDEGELDVEHYRLPSVDDVTDPYMKQVWREVLGYFEDGDITSNVFCATGPGGGVDPTCGKGDARASFPSGPGDVTVLKDLPGSTGPKLVVDKNGKKWVMKTGPSADALLNEVSADHAYRALGVKTPRSALVNGTKFSEFIEGGEELGKWRQGKSAAEIAEMHAKISKHFVADAVLANWDSVGTGANNILIKDGEPWRIDNGGALKYRAKGAPKGSAFGPQVGELKSLKDEFKNPDAAKVFKDVTHEDIVKQIAEVSKARNDVLAAVKDPVTAKILEQRFDNLKEYSSPAAKPKKKGPEKPFKAKDALSGLTHKELTKGVLTKIDLVNPNGPVNGILKVPSGLSKGAIEAIEKHLNVAGEKTKTAGLLKGKNKAALAAELGISGKATRKFSKGMQKGTATIKEVSTVKQQFKNTHLTPEERSEVVNYTGIGYIDLNKQMRKCPPKFECLQGYLKDRATLIQSAIDKAPKLATPIEVRRGIDVSSSYFPKFLDLMKKREALGQHYQFPSFTSTSLNKGFTGNVKFHISGVRTGLYVAPISQHKSEQEVLISPNTKYKIVKVVPKDHNMKEYSSPAAKPGVPNKGADIYLEEIG